MANRDSKNWKLLANIGVFALLAIYYLYSRDMTAALAIAVGLLIYTVTWLVNALRDNRQDRNSEKDNAARKKSKKRLKIDT